MRSSIKRLHRARPRWQRAFAAWLMQRDSALLLHPRLARRTDQHLSFAFAALPQPAQGRLHLIVGKNNVHITVSKQGQPIDWLLDLDVLPHPAGRGRYVDPYLEEPLCQHIFDSAFALRRTHLYEPLAHWITHTLAAARWVWVHQDSGFSHARLVRQPCQLGSLDAHSDPTSFELFALQPLPNPTHTTHYNKALAHMAAHMGQGSWATVTPSISYWQRRLNVGYHTAVAVHAQLVADGFIHRASDDDPWRFHLPQRGA